MYYKKNPDASRHAENTEAVAKLRDFVTAASCDPLEDRYMKLAPLVKHRDRKGNNIPRDKLMKSALPKHSIVAFRVTVAAIRVSQYKKDGGGKKKGDKKGFKNVLLSIDLAEVHWLANGVPWGGGGGLKEIKYGDDDDDILAEDDGLPPEDMGGVLPDPDSNGKRKPDSDDPDDDADDDDDAMLVAAAEAADKSKKKVKKAKKDDVQRGDPE